MKKILFETDAGKKEAVYSEKQWEDIEKLLNKFYQYIRDYMDDLNKEYKNFSVEKAFKKRWKDYAKRPEDHDSLKRVIYKVDPNISEEEFKKVIKDKIAEAADEFEQSKEELKTLRVVVGKIAETESEVYLTKEELKQLERVFIGEIALSSDIYAARGTENLDHEYIDYLYILLYRIQGDNLLTSEFYSEEKKLDYYRKMSEEDLKRIIQNNL